MSTLASPQPDSVIFTRALTAGLGVWALATCGFRLFGQHLLFPDPAALLVAFAVVGGAMAVVGPYLRRAIGAASAQADATALILIVPGMVLDAAATGLFAEVFPNMDARLAPYFGALMLWGYAIAGFAIMVQARFGKIV